jgi:hypothetical protein
VQVRHSVLSKHVRSAAVRQSLRNLDPWCGIFDPNSFSPSGKIPEGLYWVEYLLRSDKTEERINYLYFVGSGRRLQGRKGYEIK